MNTEFLARFIAVAEHGNITRAAHSLHLSQSTLSKQMMTLEEEFGIDEMSEDDVAKIKNVGDLVAYLQDRVDE